MATFSKLKLVDENVKSLVFGWVRSIKTSFDIPIVINNLCLLYYFMEEKFENHSKTMLISSSNKKLNTRDVAYIINNSYSSFVDSGTVYGKLKIDSSSYPNSILNWTITCKSSHLCTMLIGIVSSNNPDHCRRGNAFQRYNPGMYYSWSDDFSARSKGKDLWANLYNVHYDKSQSPDLKDGHDYLIKMSFNIKQRALRFSLNGTDLGVLYDDIDISQNYYLAISSNKRHSEIKLLHFNITQNYDSIVWKANIKEMKRRKRARNIL